MILKKPLTNYVISFDTFMLQPVLVDNKTVATRVIERNREFTIPKKPIHIVKKSCSYYGGSLETSINIAKIAIGRHHKTPIIVAHDFGTPYIFLPTMSPSAEGNTWISHHSIDFIAPDNTNCIVYLENNLSFKLNISATTMYRQYAFGNLLEKNFYRKQRQLNRPSSFGNYEEFYDE